MVGNGQAVNFPTDCLLYLARLLMCQTMLNQYWHRREALHVGKGSGVFQLHKDSPQIILQP